MKAQIPLAALFALFLLCGRAFAELHEVHEVHYQMATFLELTVWDSDPNLARSVIRAAVEDVHRLEEEFSTFKPESVISKFNHQAGHGKMRLPSDLYELLRTAKTLSDKTDGYFDITVGPLVTVWRKCLANGKIPSDRKLAHAMQQVGSEKLKLYDHHMAALAISGMKIDLGGIGKGYAVDRMVDRFEAAGIRSALINFGNSSMFAIGAPPGKSGWQIGIRGPNAAVRGVIELRDMALSTSGSLGKFWTVGHKKYGHLINPKSGQPVSDSRMATVVSPTATAAEALTKPMVLVGGNAFFVLSYFPQSEAVFFSERKAPIFSVGFKSKALWRKVPKT